MQIIDSGIITVPVAAQCVRTKERRQFIAHLSLRAYRSSPRMHASTRVVRDEKRKKDERKGERTTEEEEEVGKRKREKKLENRREKGG